MRFIIYLSLLFEVLSFSSPFKPTIQFDFGHLDKENAEKLEKMYYLKNKKYSPFKSSIYRKYRSDNPVYVANLTEAIQHIEEALKNNNETIDIKEIIYNKPDTLSKDGYFDILGVFHPFNKPSKKQRPSFDYSPPPTNNNQENDGNFEIIKNTSYSFKNIGGYDAIKKELLQTSDILINYHKYEKYNVRTPKGIIFEGPPGNGKTLMVKCLAGEINASFIPVSGSEFSERYVGVGASRMRELFNLASQNKPCIIFIDEIDAVARKRGNDLVTSNSEKDQTLNQLLTNLDGFKSSNGIFLIGATNRYDILDPALIRPGRIDKNIYIGNPDSKTRQEIINIHLKGKPLSQSIDIPNIVEMTSGFSGAQIENLLNEAMLHALRDNREIITDLDLEYIADRLLTGWQSTELKYSDDIVNRIVIHEMGHALVGFLSSDHSKLVKVCLNLGSPKNPGYTVFESNEENLNIYTKEGLLSHLIVLLAGRVAEEIFYGSSITSGARLDLQQAYSLAQNMVLQYGMGRQTIYPDMSDKSKYLIDQEINALLFEAHSRAFNILTTVKNLVVDCKEILKKNKILKPDNIIDIINLKYPEIWEIYKIDVKNNY